MIRHKTAVLLFFVLLSAASVVCMQTVKINYNIIDYLPDDAASTTALSVLEEEFTAGIPNVRLMIPDVTIPEALTLKSEIADIDGVRSVIWLDDMADLYAPIETLDADTVAAYYKDGSALFTVTVEDAKAKTALPALRELAGEDAAMSGMRVNTTFASDNINGDLTKVMLLAVPIILVILLLTTNAWIEPFLFLVTIGVAILLNMGTNAIFGEISF
ncbi:MAG: MMPL family transporter, partial [Methanocorpusculum sp.]|nr:MMPL family transporter [Methanocorpusculum sp.]